MTALAGLLLILLSDFFSTHGTTLRDKKNLIHIIYDQTADKETLQPIRIV
jgi:hypothetical protein